MPPAYSFDHPGVTDATPDGWAVVATDAPGDGIVQVLDDESKSQIGVGVRLAPNGELQIQCQVPTKLRVIVGGFG